MTAPTSPAPDRPRPSWVPWVLAVVYAAGIAGGYAFFVRTGIGQRLDEAAFFGRDGTGAGPIDPESILGGIELTLLATLLAVVMVLAFLRGRLDLASVVLAVVVGSNLTTQVLKLNVLERPHLIPDAFRLANSFPSGHVTAVASLAVAAVLVAPRRSRPLVAALTAGIAVVIGFATVAAGWHRPGDVMGAWFVVGLWAALSSGVMVSVGGGGAPRPVTRASALLERTLWVLGGLAAAGFLAASAAWVVLGWSEPGSETRTALALAAGSSGMGAAAVLVSTSIVAATRRYPLAPEHLGRA